MQQELIDKLYAIAISGSAEEFKNSIQLFNNFCQGLSSVRTLDEKSFTILKVILNNHELLENEYLVSNILDSLRYMQERVCWQVSQSKEASLNDLDTVLSELNRYKDIKDLVSNPNYEINNSINQSSVNQYANSQIYVYYVDSLMRILSSNYLTIPKEKSDEIMDLIYNDGWLNDLLEGKIQNSMLNRDLIDKYIQRILAIKEFVSPENISDDKLVSAITNYKIKDPKLLSNLISYLTPSKLMSIFDYEMDKAIGFIVGADYMDEQFKGQLINNIIQKYLNEDNYGYLFDLLQTDMISNPLVSMIINDKTKESIMNFALNDSIMDWKNVYFLLDNNILDKNFISNSMALHGVRKGGVKYRALEAGLLTEEDFEMTINSNDTDEVKLSKMEKYNLTGRVVDYHTSLDLLNKYFNGQIQLSMESTKAIVRSIIKQQLEKNDVRDVNVLFDNLQQTNGSFNEKNRGNYISISMRQIEKMLDPKTKKEDRFDLFITMFHEMRHAVKHNNIENNQFDYNTYFMLKEQIIREHDADYYNSNYRLILEEIDAREESYGATLSFFKENFPSLEGIVADVIKGKIENHDYSEYSEKKFSITNKKELVSQIFDKIISLHPELLQEYPVLQLEYHPDGRIKTPAEMIVSGNYDIELVNQIKAKRYVQHDAVQKVQEQKTSTSMSDIRNQITALLPYSVYGLEKVSDKDLETIMLRYNNSTLKEPLRMYECMFLTLKNNPRYDDVTEKVAQLFETLAEEKRVETSHVSLWGKQHNPYDPDIVEINEVPYRVVRTSKPYHTLGNYAITLSDVYSYRISKGMATIPETLNLKISSPKTVNITKYESLRQDLESAGMVLPKYNNAVVKSVFDGLVASISNKTNGILSNARYTHLTTISDPIVQKQLQDITAKLKKGNSVYDIESAEARLAEVTILVDSIIAMYNKQQEREQEKAQVRINNQARIQALQDMKRQATEKHTYNPIYTDDELQAMHPEQIDDRELLKQALAELGGTSVLTEQSDVYSMYDENGKEVYFKKIIDNGRSITQPITFEEFQALGGVSMEEKLGSSGKSR